jgi:hypothetical protein
MFNLFNFGNNSSTETISFGNSKKVEWAKLDDSSAEKEIRGILTDVTFDEEVMKGSKQDIAESMKKALADSGLPGATVSVSTVTHLLGGKFATCIVKSPKTGELLKIDIGD